MYSDLLSENFLLKLHASTQILKALDHRLRQRMLDVIDLHYSMNAEGLSNQLGVNPSIVNQHLDILRRANILILERQGKQFFFSVNYDKIDKITHFIQELNQGSKKSML